MPTKTTESWITGLTEENLLAVYDVVLDIQADLQFREDVRIPILPSVVRFPALLPADAANLRDRYCALRWKAAELLKQKGSLNALDVDKGSHRWERVIKIRVNQEPFDEIADWLKREHARRTSGSGGAKTQAKGGETQTTQDLPSSKTVATDLALPENVTMSWLARHVPVSFWLWAVAIVAAAFSTGVAAGQTGFVRELLGYSTAPPLSTESVREHVDELTRGHNENVAALTSAIVDAERKSAASVYPSDQQPHVESATRLKQALKDENEAFLEALQNLRSLAAP
jgi:hypothetical protein